MKRWEIQCENCKVVFSQAEIEVDHIEPAGKCTDAISACTYLFRLLIDQNNMRVVCKGCHAIFTHMEKKGVGWDEAVILKKLIRVQKKEVVGYKVVKKRGAKSGKKVRTVKLINKTVDEQQKELLLFGYTKENLSNKSKREAAYLILIEKEMI